jgi:hypothetical protein
MEPEQKYLEWGGNPSEEGADLYDPEVRRRIGEYIARAARSRPFDVPDKNRKKTDEGSEAQSPARDRREPR